ncbi:MAG TPA: SUMF1/EgtB/PvdO family nonheme iron enzyme [Thermoanaerobaculia bacterium]|nr:SUMF1/EgtB/PvdO family nonheme iron enzyme [Thermoanaerobaculia bacterium]
MYGSTLGGARTCILLAVVGVAAAAGPSAPQPRLLPLDPFLDGSGRTAPAMALIPAGRFLMGSTPRMPEYRALEVPHRVELDAFALGRTEVTNQELAEFLNEEGNDDDGLPFVDLAAAGGALRFDSSVYAAAPAVARRPATAVSWRGARAYCRWLSQKTGRLYELPTEAQWEWAARAGAASVWPWGDTFDAARLNCRGRDDAGLEDVGAHPADAYGVFDLLGNAWEWVLDCFAPDFYLYSPTHDPRLLDAHCLAPGIRGGSFRDPPGYCRPSYRMNFWWRGEESIGFRVARRLVPWEETAINVNQGRPDP